MKEELRICEDETKIYREALREIQFIAKKGEKHSLKLIERTAKQALELFNDR